MDISTLNAFSAYSSVGWPASPMPSARVERHEADGQRSKIDDKLAAKEADVGSSENTKELEESSEPTAGPTRPDGTPLAPEEIQQLEQLKQTDREVRQHEMAHQTAGGPYTGGASYEYEVGPDGKRYAVAGEVPIDYGPVPGDPHATVEKMQTVIAAAMAPADPSPKDLQVAAQARQYLLEAKLEAAQQQSEMNQARSEQARSEQERVTTGDAPPVQAA